MTFLLGSIRSRQLTLGILTTLISMAAWAQTSYKATIFERGSNRGKKLFTLDVTWEKQGDNEVGTAVYKDMAGEIALIEKSTLKGAKVIEVEIDQRQENAKAIVTYNNDSAKFKTTESGKTKESNENVKGDFVMPGSFARYVHSRWPDLEAGKTVEFRYGVWFRRETIGFKIRKSGEQGSGDNKRCLLHMKASSFFVAAMVDPIDFKFSCNGDRMYEVNGRVAPKLKKDGKLHDLDAELVYSY